MTRILDRDLSVVQTKEVRGLGGPILRSVVDEAATAFERCSDTAEDGDHNLGILLPFHHLVEMLDGVEVLLDRSCVAASIAPLRSAFESSLGLHYILQEDTRRRALAYVVGDIKARIRWHEEHDPSTRKGEAFSREMDLANRPDFPMPAPSDAREAVRRDRDMLSAEPFREISEEWDRQDPRYWFSLFGGPAHRRELASSLGQVDDYLIFYRAWSDVAHGTDLYRRLTRSAGGDAPAVAVIRYPIGMPWAYVVASQLGVEATKAVLEHYRPGELKRFARWYLETVAPPLERLGNVEEEVR